MHQQRDALETEMKQEVGMIRNFFELTRFAREQRIRMLAAYGIGAGLAAALAFPTSLFAAPFAFGGAGQFRTAAPETVRDDVLLAHCCHSHPYSPYDSYCCHEPAGYYAGRAVVGAAVAYGTYRGVKSAYKHHHKKYHSRRR